MVNEPREIKCENFLRHSTVVAFGFSGLTFREGHTEGVKHNGLRNTPGDKRNDVKRPAENCII